MISIENKKYSIYLLKYLGVALIAGSVVHVGTLQTGATRYIVLGCIGLVLMLVGNILEAKLHGEKINLKYLTVITGLSLATGFFSGGIQHYLDNPGYAGYLLAIGLLFSYITFFLRDKIKLLPKNITLIIIISLAIIAVSLSIKPLPSADHHGPAPAVRTPVLDSTGSTHVDAPGSPAHTH